MKLKKADKSRLIEMIIEVPKTMASLAQAGSIKNSQLYWMLHPFSPEALIYAYAIYHSGRVHNRIHFYLASLRGVKVAVDGRALRKMGFPPSPMYNIVLRELLKAKLDGKVRTPEDQERFVAERAAQLAKEMKE
jgi:tRNA nucleotidyltransferase (CCA-adding enzyme)